MSFRRVVWIAVPLATHFGRHHGGRRNDLYPLRRAAGACHLCARRPQRVAIRDRRRWSKIVMASIAFLLLSGFYNYFLIVHSYREVLPKWYHMLFGISSSWRWWCLPSPACWPAAPRWPIGYASARFWLSLNILLVVLIVCISGILRTRIRPAGPPSRPIRPVNLPPTLRPPSPRPTLRPPSPRPQISRPPPRSLLPAPTCASPLSPWTRKPRRKSTSCEIA